MEVFERIASQQHGGPVNISPPDTRKQTPGYIHESLRSAKTTDIK